MLPQAPSLVRLAVLTTAALVLGLSATQSAHAQPPIATGGAQGYQEPGPITPEIYEAGGGQQRTSTGQARSTPVLTPGYFEVVCPAICYGGAFHVCGVRAFGGPGYYGPFRRLWAYSTYGPNFNIGPDNSIQFGLQSGVMYVAMRHGKGCYKHGSDCACRTCALCLKGGSAAAAYGAIAQIGSLGGAPPSGAPERGGATPQGPSRPPAEKLPPPTGNTAHLRLLVPENAEVLVEGRKTTATGTVREFVSPPLGPGKNLIYSVLVRYTDAGGKVIEETHSIRVHANDRLDIDCTKPANAEQPRATVLRP